MSIYTLVNMDSGMLPARAKRPGVDNNEKLI